MEPGRSFDRVAALYDAQRSGYPEKLFADISEIAALERGDRVLEVGCGSGLATSGFVALGLEITAIDPGPSLVALARQKFANSSNVQFFGRLIRRMAAGKGRVLPGGCGAILALGAPGDWIGESCEGARLRRPSRDFRPHASLVG